MFGESFKFFDPPNTKRWSFNFFKKLNKNHILIANVSKLFKYKTFGLMAWHNLSKGQSADRILKLWKSCVYDYRPSNMQLLKFWLFNFSNLQTTLSKILGKKIQVSKYMLEVLIKVYRFDNIYDLKFLDNETTAFWFFFF